MTRREGDASTLAAERREWIATEAVHDPTFLEDPAEVHRRVQAEGWKISLDAVYRDIRKIKATLMVDEQERRLAIVSLGLSRHMTTPELLRMLAASKPPIVISRSTLFRWKREVRRLSIKAITEPLDTLVADEVAQLREMERTAQQEIDRASNPEDMRRWTETRLKIKQQIASMLNLQVPRPIEVAAGTNVLGLVPITSIVVERPAPAPEPEREAS